MRSSLQKSQSQRTSTHNANPFFSKDNINLVYKFFRNRVYEELEIDVEDKLAKNILEIMKDVYSENKDVKSKYTSRKFLLLLNKISIQRCIESFVEDYRSYMESETNRQNEIEGRLTMNNIKRGNLLGGPEYEEVPPQMYTTIPDNNERLDWNNAMRKMERERQELMPEVTEIPDFQNIKPDFITEAPSQPPKHLLTEQPRQQPQSLPLPQNTSVRYPSEIPNQVKKSSPLRIENPIEKQEQKKQIIVDNGNGNSNGNDNDDSNNDTNEADNSTETFLNNIMNNKYNIEGLGSIDLDSNDGETSFSTNIGAIKKDHFNLDFSHSEKSLEAIKNNVFNLDDKVMNRQSDSYLAKNQPVKGLKRSEAIKSVKRSETIRNPKTVLKPQVQPTPASVEKKNQEKSNGVLEKEKKEEKKEEKIVPQNTHIKKIFINSIKELSIPQLPENSQILSIELIDALIPRSEYTIRQDCCRFSYQIDDNDEVDRELEEGFYTLEDLVNDIADENINALICNKTKRIKIFAKQVPKNRISLTFKDEDLGKLLGYKKAEYNEKKVVKAESKPNFDINNYIYMYLCDIQDEPFIKFYLGDTKDGENYHYTTDKEDVKVFDPPLTSTDLSIFNNAKFEKINGASYNFNDSPYTLEFKVIYKIESVTES